MNLADKIRAEGDTATRPGQMTALHDIAWQVEDLEVRLNQYRERVEALEEDRAHWRRMYLASVEMNNDLLRGLEIQKAQAWDEGYTAGYDDANTIASEWSGGQANPYRGDA